MKGKKIDMDDKSRAAAAAAARVGQVHTYEFNQMIWWWRRAMSANEAFRENWTAAQASTAAYKHWQLEGWGDQMEYTMQDAERFEKLQDHWHGVTMTALNEMMFRRKILFENGYFTLLIVRETPSV